MNALQYRRVVVKVGTSTLAYSTGLINIRQVERLVKVLADLKNAGCQVLLVSSGAIGVGAGKLGLKSRPKDIPTKQAAAAVGQCELMYLYDKLFGEYNHSVSQLLLTRDVVEHPARKQNVTNTIETLLNLGVIPIINENDTVAIEEIEFGDNDTLSAIVAEVAAAELLVLMSDIDGLYDRDPRKDPNARLIHTVTAITPQLEALAGGAGSENGTGGMITKLHAGAIAEKAGFDMAIVNGEKAELLYPLCEGKPEGTFFRFRKPC